MSCTNATSSSCFCNHISIIPSGSAFKMCANCSGAILLRAVLREEEKKTEKLSSIHVGCEMYNYKKWARAKMKNARAKR